MDKAHSPGSPARSSPVRAVGRETPLFSINQNTHNGSASVGGGGTGGGGGGAGGAAQAVLEHHPISFILAEKEKQLKTLYQSLEQRLSEREAECGSLRQNLSTLQDDFFYNLQLLQERDAELEKLEETVSELKSSVGERDAKLQHSKAILEEKVSQVINLKHLVQDLEKSKLDLIHKENREKENITSQLKLDQQNMDAHYQKQILALESSLREKDYEISTLNENHTSLLDRQSRAHNSARESLQLEYQDKLRSYEKRLQAAADRERFLVQDFKGYEAKIKEIEGEKRAMEAAHREKEWDFSDGAKAMNALMEDLKAQLDMAHAKATNDQKRREEEVAKSATLLKEQEESFKSLQSVLETRIRELELKVEQSRIEMDNEQDRHEQYTQVLMEEKNQLENNSIRLRSSVDDAQQELEKSKFAHNAELFEKDAVITELRNKLAQLELDMKQRQEDNSKLKKDLSTSVEKELFAHKDIIQLNLEWERKYDEMLKQKFRDDDSGFHHIVAAKDRAEAEVKLLKSQLDNLQAHLMEKQSRRASPQVPDEFIQRSQELEQENADLKGIVRQMRQDMESLETAIPNDLRGGASRRRVTDLDAEMYREESERLYDQFQKFQELLRQKQKIINDLMQQQATMHETIMDASSSMRAMSNQSPLDRYAGFSQPPPPPPPLASSSRILDEVYDEFEERLLIGKEENEMLRKKLKSVIAQLQGVMRERNQLMDLSNSLKAEIETRQQIISTNNNENVLLNSSADNSKANNLASRTAAGAAAAKSSSSSIGASKQPTSSFRVTSKRPVISGGTMTSSSRTSSSALRDISARSDLGKIPKKELRARGIRNWNEVDDF